MWLLAAQSARMLAQSAARAGLDVCALDCFADADTRRLARRWAVPANLELDGWIEAADRLAAPAAACGLVYGSGIDTRPELVERLAQGRALFGNPPATLRLVHSPPQFFHLLGQLNIPYPPTRFSAPRCFDGWLVKPGCGEGGKGVGFAAKNSPAQQEGYYQRRIPGPALSLLFLADGATARTVGFNTQYTAAHDPAQPFLFAGAVNRADLDSAQRGLMETYAGRLTVALSLAGLNSLDFMLARGRPWVLELNPRPSATLALYDGDFAEGLLALHIAACRSELPKVNPGPVRALRIIYAPQPVRIGEGATWPSGCADLPNPGADIAAGQPLCSVMAEGAGVADTLAALRRAQAECLGQLYKGMP